MMRDLEKIQKELKKKETEQQEQLSKDVFQAMITSSHDP